MNGNWIKRITYKDNKVITPPEQEYCRWEIYHEHGKYPLYLWVRHEGWRYHSTFDTLEGALMYGLTNQD